MRTEYLSAFRTLLTLPLRRADADAPGGPEAAISTVLELMNDYCISREQVWGKCVWGGGGMGKAKEGPAACVRR